MYSYGPPHMAEQNQDDQYEHTFSNYVRIRDVVQKTCQRRWTIGKSGERGSGISVLPARHDDDDWNMCHCFYLESGIGKIVSTLNCIFFFDSTTLTKCHFFSFNASLWNLKTFSLVLLGIFMKCCMLGWCPLWSELTVFWWNMKLKMVNTFNTYF